MKTILITGGAGFIGTHLAEAFADTNRVVLFDNLRRDSLSTVPELRKHKNVTFMQGDIRDAAALAPAIKGADVVLHLAAIAGVSSYYERSLETLQVNIQGTINVLESAKTAGVKHVVHFSTSETFGADAMWVHEESGFNVGPSSDARWVYATSKLAGEQFTLRSAETYGYAGTVVRPFNVYGPRQVGEGAISNFCRAAVSSEPLVIYGEGSPIRAWCYISDFVGVIKTIVERPDITAGQSFNIGNPNEVATTAQLAHLVLRASPGATLTTREMKRAEVRSRVPDIARARKVLGFNPTVSLHDGVEKTLAWFRGQHELATGATLKSKT